MLKIEISDKVRKEIECKHLRYFFKVIKKKFPNCKLLSCKRLIKKLAIGNPADFFDEENKLKYSFLNDKHEEETKTDKNGKEKKYRRHKYDFRKEYKKFRSPKTEEEKKNWNGLKLIQKLGINVCPYCNMNYIQIIEREDKSKIIEATFDHYYSKADYPFLALNLYNLIPSCHKCNSVHKLKKEAPILNPYYKGWKNNVVFRTKIKDGNINYLLSPENKKNKFEIEIKNFMKNKDDSDKVKNEKEDILQLTARYNTHQDMARSIIKKKIYYNESYRKELNSYGIFADGELGQMLISQDLYDHNEPFSKFKRDIWDEISD